MTKEEIQAELEKDLGQESTFVALYVSLVNKYFELGQKFAAEQIFKAIDSLDVETSKRAATVEAHFEKAPLKALAEKYQSEEAKQILAEVSTIVHTVDAEHTKIKQFKNEFIQQSKASYGITPA